MKKILPKNTSPSISAEDLEASFQKTHQSIQETTSKTLIDIPPSVESSEKPFKKTASKQLPASKRAGRSRVSIDIPDALFAQLEQHKEESGQTMTHLVVTLLKKFFAEKKY